MRNTTKAIAALAAVAATLAFGASTASALTWSQTASQAGAVGELTFTRDGHSYTATCDVVLGLSLNNSFTGAIWSTQGGDLPCQDSRGPNTVMPIDKWHIGATALVGGSPVMTMKPGSTANMPSPFSGNSYTNLNPGTITLDVINGNATTPTKIVFNNDRVGNMVAGGGGGLYATGELDIYYTSLITLN